MVLRGETEEFRYFIKNYKDMAFSVALSVVKDETLAADVVQEAFIKAFQNLKSFKGNSKFSTWLYRIVVNESIKLVRKNGDNFVSIYSVKDPDIEHSTEYVDGFNEVEQSYFINEGLKRIAANESLVLRLYYLSENSIKEVCEITGWSETNVKVLMHRGRKHMEKELKDLMYTETQSLR